MDMFLEYNYLIKHNSKVNWNTGIIQFIRCPRECKTQYQDISLHQEHKDYNEQITRTKNNRK